MNISKDLGLLDEEIKIASMPICDKVVSNDIANDHILPDYLPEIRRVLYSCATVHSPAKYITSSGAEFNGKIDYNILYVGGDGQLYSASVSDEYDFEIPLDLSGFDLNDEIITCVDSLIDTLNVRVIGPRKLNVKCRFNSRTRLYGSMPINYDVEGNCNKESIETYVSKEACVKILRCENELIEVSDETPINSEEVRVVSADGSVWIESVTAKNAQAQVEGAVCLKIIYMSSENGEVENIYKKIPFETVIDVEGLTADSLALAKGTVNDISINIIDGSIVCDLSFCVQVEAQHKTEISYFKDMYSTERRSDCTYRSIVIPKIGFTKNGNFTFSERVAVESTSIKSDAAVVECFASVGIEKTEQKEDSIEVSGNVKFTLIVKNNDEYSNVEFILPVKYEFDAVNNVNSFETAMNVFECSARIDNDTVSLNAEIGVVSLGLANEEITVLDKVLFEEEINKDKGILTVCYLGENDDLWTVAKKHHVKRAHLEKVNNLNINNNYLII